MRALAPSLAIAIFALAFLTSPARADDPLTGPMNQFNVLLGAPWACSSNFPAMFNAPAHTERSTTIFDVVADNVLHSHSASDQYSADSYFGYFPQASIYWVTRSDSKGVSGSLSSSDGRSYSGKMSIGPLSMTATSAFTKVGSNSYTSRNVLTVEGQQFTIDGTCTR
jgi:hypothetical protein